MVSISLLMASTGYAQQGSNPFEIIRSNEEKTDTGAPATKVSAPNQTPQKTNNNEFEVYRKDDSLNPPIPKTTSTQDSIGQEDVSTSKESQGEEIDIDAEEINYLSDNPFEVTHVPYRRSELKEQAKNASKTNETTKSKNRSVVNLKSTSNTFIFWLVLFTLLLLAIVVNVQRNAVLKVAKSITNENVLKLSKREENGGLTGHYIMLYVMFFINLACFIYLIAKRYNGFDGFSNWLIVFGIVSGAYILRHISMAFIGGIFDIQKDSSLYSFTIMTFNIFLGLILMPINLVTAFSPPEISSAAMYTGIGLILILLLIRSARGLLIGVRFIGEHLFQIFLYLCVFEIAPILILLRILGDQ